MADVDWSKKAFKQWLALPKPERTRIAEAVDGLVAWPDCRNVKALAGREDYRLRVGRYRVIFTVDRAPLVVRIEEVRKRDDRTYSTPHH